MKLRRAAICVLFGTAVAARTGAGSGNPIRKVVNLLQNMQKEIEAQGESETELHDKFMCYCETNEVDLTKQIEDAKGKIEELHARVKEAESEKAQVALDIADSKKDREEAKADLQEATAMREKEKATFDSESADAESNIGAITGALAALEKGVTSLLQLPGIDKMKSLVDSFPDMDPMDRRNLQAFLQQGSTDFSPDSSQIVGILKQMKDDLSSNLDA